MAVELYIDVLILEDDWCINWLMWKCGIRVLTGDIALISTDDPPQHETRVTLQGEVFL